MNGGKKTGPFNSRTNPLGTFQLSQLNSGAVQAQLKAAGIDTNSKQYKAVIREMMKSANGNTAMYTNPTAIKNLMKQYNKDGYWVDPITGLTGLLVTDENIASKNRIIDIPESSRQEMFELTKKEILRENGVCNGDTTKRTDIYINMYWKSYSVRSMRKKNHMGCELSKRVAIKQPFCLFEKIRMASQNDRTLKQAHRLPLHK